MPPRSNKRKSGAAGVELRLSNALLLNKFMLSLFGASSLEALSEHLKDPALEGYDENNVSFFYNTLIARPIPNSELTAEQLLVYDQNIFRHTLAISGERGERIRWKYYQYLSLLFTEIYLDRYFNARSKLLYDIQAFQQDIYNFDPATWHGMKDFSEADLNKLAFWSATGSGKTLLMHVNILQFKHYAEGHADINRTILVTPNAGLTQQHIDEFKLSNLPANVFSKKFVGGFFDKDSVDIIEITKLSESDGDKTVAVDSFESNNLVLVDEGHRGSSGDSWKTMRDRLSTDGFAFEYSATFGEAVSAQNSDAKKKALLDEYGCATIFDYSYRYFYNDGYGKDYHILNLGDTARGFSVTKYLTACLLGFYEQLRLFKDKNAELTPFMIEKPLAIFVGSTVSVSSTNSDWKQEMSDIVYILNFFKHFISNCKEAIDVIDILLKGTDGLVDKNNNPIFTRSFRYIRSLKMDAETVYYDMLRLLFNNEVAGAQLHLDNLKGIDGEIGLRVGNSPYFGIINVGDSKAVTDKCAEAGINTMPMEYGEKSLFATINNPNSTLNVLIGSKKFSEGWSSWRVSTMGLLNVGRSEGSQIIQLFGRGVRLKGYKFSLKRSSALDPSIAPASIPKHISSLETLNIFGIHSDYMEVFNTILKEHGLPTNDSEFREFTLPVMPTVSLANKQLKYLRVKDGKDFKRDVIVNLKYDGVGTHIITLDYYPRVSALRSNSRSEIGKGEQHESHFTSEQLQFLDWKKIFFDIEEFKNERSWHNLSLSPNRLKEIMSEPAWYRLFIPEYDMQFNEYATSVALWEEIVTTLLKLYVERTYNITKSKFMADNVEVAILDQSNPNFEKEYSIWFHKELDYFVDKLTEVKASLSDKTFAATVNISNSRDFQALYIAQHLYQPLLYINHSAFSLEGVNNPVRIAPVALNLGERNFVNSIQHYHDTHTAFFANKQLYLLRNKSKQGIGFFDVHGFYPDFIVWLVVGQKQYVSFIDPKGITHLRSFEDPKIQLYRTIRTEIEPRLNDSDIILNSFIISNTPISRVSHWAGLSHTATLGAKEYQMFNDRHVYFQSEQAESYIGKMIDAIISS